jgi:ribose/xylose/arabinose/galactoside ABC-type transport system permease subunit
MTLSELVVKLGIINMSQEPTATIEQPAQLNANTVERLMMRDIAGIPIPLIACALAAVLFGCVLAMSAGSH